jgi:hypothetical protein
MSSDLPDVLFESDHPERWLTGRERTRSPMPAGLPAPGDLGPTIAAAIPKGAALLLSGGLDSAVLFGLAPGAAVVRWRDDALDNGEERAADALLADDPREVMEVQVGEHDRLSGWEDAVRAVGRPIWNPRGVTRVLVWRSLAGRGVTSAITGLGADELLTPDVTDPVEDRVAALAHEVFGLRPPARGDRLLHDVVRDQLPLDRAGRAWQIAVHHPFLEPTVRGLLAGRAGPDKRALIEAFGHRLPPAVLERTKRPRLGHTSARQAWADLVQPWLARSALAGPALASLAARWTRGDDPDDAALERIVLRAAGAAVLTAQASAAATASTTAAGSQA